MPVVKPGGGEGGQGLKASKVKVDYIIIVKKGEVVRIEYED